MEHDELAQHLESLQRESCYRVDAVLKESPVELTQRVFFVGDNGAVAGPYIRKFIKRGFGIGGAYERIFEAQQRGHRFKYIPDMLECYTRNDELVVVMELVRGQTLQDVVYERDPSVQLALEIFPKLCDAVSELHVEFDPPIIHRDLKPSNIILTGEGLALIDFGISREYDEGAEADTTHFGTREFAPPEQYGFGQTGTYSDVYSLGMVLFFCLTEKIPTYQDRNQAFYNPQIPEAYRQVIAKAAALDPAARFASANELKYAFLTASSEYERAAQNATRIVEPGNRNSMPAGFRNTDSVGLGNTDSVGFGYNNPAGYRHANPNVMPTGNGNTFRADSYRSASPSDIRGSNPAAIPATKNKSKFSRSVAILVAIAVICLVLIGAFGQSGKSTSSGQATSSRDSTTEQSVSSESAQPSTSASTAASATSTNEPTDSVEEELAADLDNQAAPKNGYDPKTNFTVEIAGVEFQIPQYFLNATSTSETGESFYYAETGSSVAMLMTKTTVMDTNADRNAFEAAKDDYINGMLQSDALEKVTSSTDYELAGFSARVVTISGSVKGVPIACKAAFFYDPDAHTLGLIMFGQSNNAQFDYSSDFAKVITSARRV